MHNAFQPSVFQGPDWTYVHLSGVIDEDNRLESLTEQIEGSTVFIGLSGVSRINSCGVRDWINWLEALHCGDSRIALVDCSPAIVAQLNLVGNFAKGAFVLSAAGQYYCEPCQREEVRYFAAHALNLTPFPQAPTELCALCGAEMTFDDIEESYFSFLRGAQLPAEDDPIIRLQEEARTQTELSSAKPTDFLTEEPTRITALPEEAPSKTKPAGLLTRSDRVFYTLIGVLTALLLLVVYHIAVP